MRETSQIAIICQNLDCHHYFDETCCSIVKRGKNKAGNQQYCCKQCGSWFVGTRNTIFYRRQLKKKEIIQICRYIIQRHGIRSIERITKRHRDTIGRLLEDLAVHARFVDEELLNEDFFNIIEKNELWRNIQRIKRRLSDQAKIELAKVLVDARIK